MKKTVILALASVVVVTASVGFTAPLTDYSAGKTSIDMTWRSSDIDADNSEEVAAMEKKRSLEWGVTTGLGNNFALQYIGSDVKAKESLVYDGDYGALGHVTSYMGLKLKTQEFNVLYKLDKNLSVYTGLVRLKSTMTGHGTTGNGSDAYTEHGSSDTESRLQLGLVGSSKIADKTTAYASLGVASHFTNWKVGLAQEIAPNLELNVDYRKLDAKKVNFPGEGDVDIKVKGGLGFGVSYKF